MKELKLLSLVLVAGTATLFTACTSESDNSPSAKISYETVADAQQTPVTFGTYMGEQANTRSGHAGSIALDQLKAAGFGVLAYHTDNGNFVGTAGTGSQPNFMYNQEVTWATSAWTYSPLKYWPNSIGNFTNTGGATTTATTTGVDRLSFFAYAPYVEVKTSGTPLGDVTDTSRPAKGITHITGNNVGGNPLVTYVFDDDPAYSVDLMYGVAAQNTDYGIGTTATGTITAGDPFIDMTKVKTDTQIKFDFKHALTRVGLLIQGAFDNTTPGGGTDPTATETKITVAEVVINGTNLLASGELNLNGGTWESTAGMSNLTINNKLNPVIKDNAATPASPTNAEITALFDGSSTITGVTTALLPLVSGTTSPSVTPDYYMFIPSTSVTPAEQTSITGITIKYYVTTLDDNLSSGYSRIENIITQTFTTPLSVTKGLSYLFKLNVGMTTVKIDASISADWNDTEEVLWMPINATTPTP